MLALYGLTTRQFRVYALAHGERAYGPRNGKYGRPRTGEDLQQGPAPGLGRAGRASGVIGRKGACATARAPEGGQEPSRVCDYFGGFGPHHRASRGANEGVTDVY